jgi:hypothetical protein
MFNHSEIGAQGQERLHVMQSEARHHDLVKRAQRPRQLQKDRFLLRVISFIRTASVRANGTNIKSEMTRQTLWQVYDTTSTK